MVGYLGIWGSALEANENWEAEQARRCDTHQKAGNTCQGRGKVTPCIAWALARGALDPGRVGQVGLKQGWVATPMFHTVPSMTELDLQLAMSSSSWVM